jgi:hypothetical protein
MPNKNLHIPIYDSGLIIRDGATLATLCIFYDEVRLPWMPPEAVQSFIRVSKTIGTDGKAHIGVDQVEWQGLGQFELDWDRKHALLFDAGVLKRLPPITRTFRADNLADVSAFLDGLNPNFSFATETRSIRGFFTARVLHHLRGDIEAPRLFQIETSNQREIFKTLLARELFRYLLPAIQSLEPEQILQVREKVVDTREGFSMHLQKLSAEIEKRVQGQESIDSIAQYARSLVETEIVPDYSEFRRQLAAERVGFWSNVLSKTSKVFEIREPITSPKFWGEIVAALGVPLPPLMEMKRAALTNRHLSFQFLQTIEREL